MLFEPSTLPASGNFYPNENQSVDCIRLETDDADDDNLCVSRIEWRMGLSCRKDEEYYNREVSAHIAVTFRLSVQILGRIKTTGEEESLNLYAFAIRPEFEFGRYRDSDTSFRRDIGPHCWINVRSQNGVIYYLA